VGKAASILVFANVNWTIVNTEEDIVDNKRTNVSSRTGQTACYVAWDPYRVAVCITHVLCCLLLCYVVATCVMLPPRTVPQHKYVPCA
jgi:hypothetical protein